jgi:hypothetical protein
MTEAIIFKQVPLPPTSNHAFVPIRIGKSTRLVPSKDHSAFKREFKRWALLNQAAIGDARETCKSWTFLEVVVYVCINSYTKIGDIRKVDGTNRIKLLHDCLADVLKKDDATFFKSSVSKVHVADDLEQCIIIIKPTVPDEYESISKLKMLI